MDHLHAVQQAGGARVSFEIKVTEGGSLFIETACPGKHCDKPYRIDALHPEYARIKAALEASDRSVLRCYHKADIFHA